MSDAVTEFRRTFKVNKFRITLSCLLVAGKPVDVKSTWEPYHPGGLTGQAYRQYRRKRDACIAALAEHLGGAVVVGDGGGFTALGPDGSKEVIASN